MAWLLPELEVGVELELMPLELELPELELPLELELPELEVPLELEVPELEVPELGVPELEVPELEVPEFEVPEPAEDEFPDVVPVDDVAVVFVAPGSPRASAPVVTTLARPTAVVTERTLRRPCCLAAMARRMPSRCELMSPILWSGLRKSLHEPSR